MSFKRIMFYRSLSVLAVLLLLATSCLAKELRIVDKRGLTRAVKQVEKSATVVIRLEAGNNEQQTFLTLQDEEGIESSFQQVVTSTETRVTFAPVKPGVWKILLSPHNRRLEKIQLTE